MPGLAAVSLAIMVSLVLVARPTHEPPPVPPVIALLPPAAEPEPAVHAQPATVKAAPAAVERVRARHAETRTARVTHAASARAVRSNDRLLVAHVRYAWPDAAMLTRVAVPLSGAYRVPPRDALQSP